MGNSNKIDLFRPYVTEEAIEEVGKVLRSGWIGLGPKVEEFEEAFAKYVGAKYAIAVNSATAALHLALVVSGIGPGDEVLTTPMTFVSTNHAIKYAGAEPVFCDVEDTTLNIDLNSAKVMMGPRVKAIIAVHYGGNPVDWAQLVTFAEENKLKIIVDAAQSLGATSHGRRVGGNLEGGLTCFSFHAVKPLPVGDGGMITTNDPAAAKRLKRLRWMGIDRSTYERSSTASYHWEYDIREVGFKYHMNDITAAIGLVHLKHVGEWLDYRRGVVSQYKWEEGGYLPFELVGETPNASSAHHLCVMRVPKGRNDLHDTLSNAGISTGVHYLPNHMYKPYKDCRRASLRVAEAAYLEILSLPLHLGLTVEDQGKVMEHINKWYSRSI